MMYSNMSDMFAAVHDNIRIDKDIHEHDEISWRPTNDEEVKVHTCLSLLRKYNINPEIKIEVKSASKSIEFRDEANKLYTGPRPDGMPLLLDSIIQTYTKSVAYAPPGSRELALAYANRSAALFTARLYDNCLQDIERALKLDYPDKSKAKLFVRKDKCLIALNSGTSESEKDLEEDRHWMEKMTDVERESIEKILNDPEQMALIEKPRVILDDEQNMPGIPNDNPEIPGASAAIELKYSEKYGRHIVAARDIEPGETLAVQQAYATVLNVERHYDHCEMCLKRTWSGIPCDRCVEAIYCSEACRDAAWIDHHDVECQIVGPLIALNIIFPRLGLMALRLVVKAVKEAGGMLELSDKLEEIDSCTDMRTRGFTGDVFDIKNYASVYTLHRFIEDRSEVFTHLILALESTLVLYLLAKRSSMFGEELHDCNWETLLQYEWTLFIGGLIMRHLQLNTSNFEITDLDYHVDQSTTEQKRGAAIVPVFSLFNHSCSANAICCSMGTNVPIYSVDFVKKGEQLFFSYGVCYTGDSKVERQKRLKSRSKFVCDCVACRKNWPTIEYLPSFMAQKLSKRLRKKLKVVLKYIDKYDNLVIAGNVDNRPEIIEGLINMVKLLREEHVQLPCGEAAAIFLLLSQVCTLRGNRWQRLD